MADIAQRDPNYVPAIQGVSSVDGSTVTDIHVNPANNKLLVEIASGGGGTSSTDDAAFTAGTDSGTPAMGFFSADTVDANDVGVLAMDASRRLLVSIEADNVGIGGGTQYTEDAAAAANPVGNAQILVRADSPAGVTTADGDNVARRATDYGAAYSQIVDSSGNFVDTFGGGTQYATNAVAPDPATGTAGLMERDDALSALTPIEGDWVRQRATAEGALWTQDFNSDAILSDTTAILADTANIDTNIAIVAGAVTGTEMQVDVVAALPAGTNAIGKLAANSGVDIGDTDVTSIIPGVGATNLGKAEDAVHSSGDTGVMALAVRSDASGALAADGDYTSLQTNDTGSLKVHEEPSKVDSGNSSTSTLANDAVFTGTGIDVLHYQAVTIQVDSSHDSATDGFSFESSIDNSNWDDTIKFTYTASEGSRRFQFPTNAQYIRLVYTNGGTTQTHFRLQTILHHTTPLTSIHRVSDTLTTDRSATLVRSVIAGETTAGGGSMVNVKVNASGTLETNAEITEALPAGDNNIGNVDIVTVPAPLSTTGGGTEATALRVTLANDSTGLVSVDDGGGSLTVDNGGTFAVQATVAAGATTIGKAEDSASADADVGVPAMARRTATPADTSGADLDYEMLQMDNGRLWASATIDAALPAGTNAIGKLAANSGVDIGDVDVTSITGVTMSNAAIQTTGDEAHDAADAGNPIKIGGRAQEPTAQPDEVANDDRVDALFDRAGRLATYQGYPRIYANINDSTSGNNTIIAAQAAGKKILITSVVVVSDGTVDVRFESGADGTALTGQIPLQAREGFSANDPHGLFETAAATLLNLELSATINVHGWVAGHVIDD